MPHNFYLSLWMPVSYCFIVAELVLLMSSMVKLKENVQTNIWLICQNFHDVSYRCYDNKLPKIGWFENAQGQIFK